MAISPTEVPSKFWRRNERIIRVCTARSWMPAATLLLRTPMPTWRCHPEEDLFRRQCITSCGSPERTECIRGIYLVIRHRMAVSGCRSSTRLHSSTQSMWALRSQCMGGRRRDATSVNRDPHFESALIDFATRASIQDLRRLRHLGGGDRLISGPPAEKIDQPECVTVAVRAPFYQHYSRWPSSVHARDQPSQPRCLALRHAPDQWPAFSCHRRR